MTDAGTDLASPRIREPLINFRSLTTRVSRNFSVPQYTVQPGEMVSSRSGPIVLIVDDDLGFVWWLGEIFSEVGCCSLPALSCKQARTLMKEGYNLDLILVNPHLPGAGALVSALGRRNANVPVVAIHTGSERLGDAADQDSTLTRPAASDQISRAEWLRKVRKLLRELKPSFGTSKRLSERARTFPLIN